MAAPGPAPSTSFDHRHQPSVANSFEPFDPEADEVDALIDLLSDDPSSPPVTTEPEPTSERPALPADQTPSPLRAAERPPEERISFANLVPSTNDSLLNCIDLSTADPLTASMPSPALPAPLPADGPSIPTSPLTVANLPNLLSRISSLIPFARAFELDPNSSSGSTVSGEGRLTGEAAKAKPQASSLLARLEPPIDVTKPVTESVGSLPLIRRITNLPPLANETKSSAPTSLARPASLTAYASLPERPQMTTSAVPTRVDAASGHATATHGEPRLKASRSGKTKSPEQERQGLRQERQMSETASRRQQAAERARKEREEEAKRYLQAKNDKSGPSASTVSSTAGRDSRPADHVPLVRRLSLESDPKVWARPIYDRSVAREPQ